jgi:hypothetical protein
LIDSIDKSFEILDRGLNVGWRAPGTSAASFG